MGRQLGYYTDAQCSRSRLERSRMIRDDTQQPIDPPLLALLALFEGPLAEVRFPDVDRSSLAALAQQVRERASLVEAAEAALVEARVSLRAAREALAQHGERALAYARVYSAGSGRGAAASSTDGHAPDVASLGEALARITLSRAAPGAEASRKARSTQEQAPSARAETKRRGPRARKSDHEARLFLEAEVAGAPAAE